MPISEYTSIYMAGPERFELPTAGFEDQNSSTELRTVISIDMIELQDIEQLQFELTTRCNARCPMCMRNYRGMEYNSGYPVTELRLEDFKKIATPELLKQIRRVLFNGNLGDFGLAHDGLEIVNYLLENNVKYVRISTNGSMRTPEWWAKLAYPNIIIGFDLDGLADTHQLYRQDTNWYRIIENATAFINAGGHAIWRFIPFDHNRHQLDACKQLANEIGFKSFEVLYDGRDTSPVYTRQGDFSHWIGNPWPPNRDPCPDIKPLLESHITWFDHKTVDCEKDTPVLNLRCNHKLQKELYIAADGSVYPCCFLGFYPGTMKHPGNSQLESIVTKNNALEYSLAECVQWFDQVENTWSKPSIADGRLYRCVNSCGR